MKCGTLTQNNITITAIMVKIEAENWRTDNEQELSYRKQITRQLRTQQDEGIYRPKYYTMTLKSGFGIVQGHWKWRGSIDHV